MLLTGCMAEAGAVLFRASTSEETARRRRWPGRSPGPFDHQNICQQPHLLKKNIINSTEDQPLGVIK
jgi:hypothetical protein